MIGSLSPGMPMFSAKAVTTHARLNVNSKPAKVLLTIRADTSQLRTKKARLAFLGRFAELTRRAQSLDGK